MSDFDLTDLNKVRQRIRELSVSVDNVYTPVQYRAPVAELEQWALHLIEEIQRGREVWFGPPLGDNHHNAKLCPYCSPELYERKS